MARTALALGSRVFSASAVHSAADFLRLAVRFIRISAPTSLSRDLFEALLGEGFNYYQPSHPILAAGVLLLPHRNTTPGGKLRGKSGVPRTVRSESALPIRQKPKARSLRDHARCSALPRTWPTASPYMRGTREDDRLVLFAIVAIVIFSAASLTIAFFLRKMADGRGH